MDCRVLARDPGATQVDLQHCVEVLDAHVEDRVVTDDARVVDEDVEAAELIDGLRDHLACLVIVGHVRVVGCRLAAAGLDDVDGQVRVATRSLARDRPAQIVHDHGRAVLRQLQSVTAADAVPRSGDDRNLAVQHAHVR